MMHWYKRSLKYFSKRPLFNAVVHVIAGIGIGFLLTYSVAGIHPVRWGIAFLVIAFLGHLQSTR
jgi:hypothetical protein